MLIPFSRFDHALSNTPFRYLLCWAFIFSMLFAIRLTSSANTRLKWKRIKDFIRNKANGSQLTFSSYVKMGRVNHGKRKTIQKLNSLLICWFEFLEVPKKILRAWLVSHLKYDLEMTLKADVVYFDKWFARNQPCLFCFSSSYWSPSLQTM